MVVDKFFAGLIIIANNKINAIKSPPVSWAPSLKTKRPPIYKIAQSTVTPSTSVIGLAKSRRSVILLSNEKSFSLPSLNLLSILSSALKALITFILLSVSSTCEIFSPCATECAVDCFFNLLLILPMNNAVIGKKIRRNKERCGLNKIIEIKKEMMMRGSFTSPSKAVKMEPWTSLISPVIRLIRSPFFCSVKKPTGSCKILAYNRNRKSAKI